MYLVTKIKQLAIPMCKVRSSLREHVCIVFICLGLQSRDVGRDCRLTSTLQTDVWAGRNVLDTLRIITGKW